MRLNYINYMEAYSMKGCISMMKLVFQRPNLLRALGIITSNDKLPHGSYRNRGVYARDMKRMGYRKIKKVWKSIKTK